MNFPSAFAGCIWVYRVQTGPSPPRAGMRMGQEMKDNRRFMQGCWYPPLCRDACPGPHTGMLVLPGQRYRCVCPLQGCWYRSGIRAHLAVPVRGGVGCSGGPELKLWSPDCAHTPSGQEESRSWPCWHGRLCPTYGNWGYFWPLAWLRFGDAEQLLVPSLSAPLSQGPAGGSKTVPTPGVNSGCSWVCRFWGRSFGIPSWSRLEMVLSSLPASLPVSLPARAFLAAVLGGSHLDPCCPVFWGF